MPELIQISLLSESGSRDEVSFRWVEKDTGENENQLVIYPEKRKQVLKGIGSSFTEASAFVLAHLPAEQRLEVMKQIFSEEGANFPIARTHMGACDFCVEGRYSYADEINDMDLASFSISVDSDGFDSIRYPGIKDPGYDLLPMIQEALSIKQGQSDATLNIMASPWTAPAWMKDIEDWYRKPTPANQHQGTGGQLKPGLEAVFANYFIKYLDAYQSQGVDIWAVTPVNEPLGNSGQWESMHFDADSQNAFIKQHLGPALAQRAGEPVQLYILDHSRPDLEHWASTIYGDPATANYVHGAAVHWYESTYKVYEDVLDRVHDAFPQYDIIHSEGCIDDLGKPAPEGVLDPEGYEESGWFDNDDFWWNDNASDWAYSVTWPGVNAEEHPIYTPVHRYARNIIVSLDHWMSGWIDWNIVLDKNGGPNHVGNFCGAPIMIDTETSQVYYTPVFQVLKQFSRSMRPGDHMVESALSLESALTGQVYSCSSVNGEGLLSTQFLNTSKAPVTIEYRVDDHHAELVLPANSLVTVQLGMG